MFYMRKTMFKMSILCPFAPKNALFKLHKYTEFAYIYAKTGLKKPIFKGFKC